MAGTARSLTDSLISISKFLSSSPLSHWFSQSSIRALCAAPSPTSISIGVDDQVSAVGSLIGTTSGAGDMESTKDGSRKVAVFWDLDNKPPKSVPPYDAAVRLIEMAARFGQVVDVAAYANRYAFAYLPLWVKEQRRERKQLDRLESAGIIKPAEPYVCGYCGRKCKTNEKLRKHFRDLHERERNKRLNRLKSLKGNRRLKYRASLNDREDRYKDAAREVLVPKVGYGLASELRRAGIYVRMVSDKPEAADEALKLHMNRSIRQGVDCICLVSDDLDFSNILKLAHSKYIHVVVVGDTSSLSRFADEKFSWRDVASGIALAKANEIHGKWSFEDGLLEEYYDDNYERRVDRARTTGTLNFSDSDSEDYIEDVDEDEESMELEGDEVWPMEGLVNQGREKKVLTRSDFWWLPESDEHLSESKQRTKSG